MEGPEIDLNALLNDSLGPIVAGLAALLVATLAGLAVAIRRVGRLERRLAGLTRGEEGDSLEAVLRAHLDKVARLSGDVRDLTARTAALEANGLRAFQRIGLVRFNPFEDTGGNQSFALVLLDAEEDGIVVSSLHARGVTRIYAKALSHGRPEAALSDEEAEALALARSASLGRAALADRTGGERSTRDRSTERAGA